MLGHGFWISNSAHIVRVLIATTMPVSDLVRRDALCFINKSVLSLVKLSPHLLR